MTTMKTISKLILSVDFARDERGTSLAREEQSMSLSDPLPNSVTVHSDSGWLNKTCTDNWECVDVANAECFNDRCMCTPGYYYSLTTGLCLSSE